MARRSAARSRAPVKRPAKDPTSMDANVPPSTAIIAAGNNTRVFCQATYP